MRAVQFVLFVLLLNASMALANSLGLFGVQVPYLQGSNGMPYGLSAIVTSANGNPANMGVFSNATISTSFGLSPGLADMALVFGYFLWGFVHTIQLFLLSFVVPAYYLVQLGFPIQFAWLFTLASWFIYAIFVWTLVTGRYVED